MAHVAIFSIHVRPKGKSSHAQFEFVGNGTNECVQKFCDVMLFSSFDVFNQFNSPNV